MKSRRHPFHLAHGAEMVSSRNFEHIVVGVSAPQKFCEKIGIARNVLQASHHRPRDDVREVGANTDVIDARDLTNVVNMVGNLGDGAARRYVCLFPLGDPFSNRLVAIKTCVQVLEGCATQET